MFAISIAPSDANATAVLQAAIDKVSAAGGGRVSLAPGLHVCGALQLKSGVDLHLEAGAVLRPQPSYDALSANTVGVIAEDSDRAILLARDASDFSVSGAGTIEAPGRTYITGYDPEIGTYVPAKLRPRVLVFEDCTNVAISGIRIADSPMWTMHLVACRGVKVTGVTVDNDRRLPNTDGLVIDSCTDVEVRNVSISTADDGVCLKTTRRAAGIGVCANVVVRDCRISSQSCALKIGTESFGDFDNIVFEDCLVTDSNRALGIFSRDGGRISNVRFARIAVECHETRDGFWGSGEALTVNVVNRRAECPAGAVEGLVIEDISGTAQGAINLVADAAAGIRDVRLSRIEITQQPGALGTGRRYDLRPTPADLAPAPGAKGRANAWVRGEDGRIVGVMDYPDGLPGLFAKGVERLVLDGVAIRRPKDLPSGWNVEPILIA